MSATGEPNPYEPPRTKSESIVPLAGSNGLRGFLTDAFTNWLMAMTVCVSFALVIGPIVIMLPFGTITERVSQLGVGFVALVVIMSLIVLPVVRLFPVYVSDIGIRTLNTWSLYDFAEWSNVTSVKPTRILFARYFLIRAKNLRWPLWLPFYMAKPKLFWPHVLSLLDADSPLAKAVREAGLVK